MRKFAFIIMALSMSACVKIPTVVMVDRKTALEEQIQPDFSGQAAALVDKGLSYRPTPYTKGQLASSGVTAENSTMDVVLRPYSSYVTDQDQLDRLLKRRCVGETRDLVVVETPKTCVGQYDQARVSRLLQRINQYRQRVLAALVHSARGRTPQQVKQALYKNLLDILVCGGQFQDQAGKWEVKRCE